MEDEPKGACYVTAHITAFPGKGEALRDVMRANIPLVRAEDGCLRYDLLCAADDPDFLMFNELWRDRAALDAHLASPHMLTYREKSSPLIAGRKLYVWNAVDVGTY